MIGCLHHDVVILTKGYQIGYLCELATKNDISFNNFDDLLIKVADIAGKQVWNLTEKKKIRLVGNNRVQGLSTDEVYKASWVTGCISSLSSMPEEKAWRIEKVKEITDMVAMKYAVASSLGLMTIQEIGDLIVKHTLNEYWFTPTSAELELAVSQPFGMYQENSYPEGYQPEGYSYELVEVIFTGLTPEEADALLKQNKKSKTTVMVKKKAMKEIGGGKKEPIVVWPFQSDSMTVGGEPLMYKAQLNKDGTVSCNCLGWAMKKKDSTERKCKHTEAIKAEAAVVYKKWKAGESLGSDFVSASKAVADASSKSLSQAIKQNKVVGEGFTLMAKRVIEL
jgi:hypothetical protein